MRFTSVKEEINYITSILCEDYLEDGSFVRAQLEERLEELEAKEK